MQAKKLLHAQLILSAIGIAHLVVSVLIYTTFDVLCGLFFLMALAQMWILIRYFTRTLRYVLARRLAKKRKPDALLIPNALLGLLLNPLLVYAFFIMAFGHLSRVIETVF